MAHPWHVGTRLAALGVVTLGGATAACSQLGNDAACDGIGAGSVQEFFAADGNPLFAADYQRAHPLGDRRTLWTFQDEVLLDAEGGHVFAHSAAALDTDGCWTVLGEADGQPWLFADRTTLEQRWFWPLGGALSADGASYGLFVAELVERGEGYLDHPEPVGVHLVTLDAESLAVTGDAPAPARGPEVYGWSVASDDDSTYLYSWCLRQWGWSDTGHDTTCTGQVRAARVPRGDLAATPEFWDGTAWQPDAGRAVSVFDRARGDVRPTDVIARDGRFVAVTKPGDWYGDTVYVDVADSPTGPWVAADTVTVAPKCAPDDCNTYFASFTGRADAGMLEVAISHNRWDGAGTEAPVVYRPTVFQVTADPADPTVTTILTYPDDR